MTTAAAYEPATIIVGWKDPNESITEDIITKNTYQMQTAKLLIKDLPVVDFRPTPRVWHSGDILFVDWIPKATDDWEALSAVDGIYNSIMSIPVTFKNIRTGKYEDAFIELMGKYAWTTTFTGTAATRSKVGRYTVPDGVTLVLGHRRAHNSRLLISLYDTSIA